MQPEWGLKYVILALGLLFLTIGTATYNVSWHTMPSLRFSSPFSSGSIKVTALAKNTKELRKYKIDLTKGDWQEIVNVWVSPGSIIQIKTETGSGIQPFLLKVGSEEFEAKFDPDNYFYLQLFAMSEPKEGYKSVIAIPQQQNLFIKIRDDVDIKDLKLSLIVKYDLEKNIDDFIKSHTREL